MRLKLKLFRINANLKQSEVAEKIGISEQCYNYIELGKRFGNLKTWKRIQILFNISDYEMWTVIND